MPQEEKGMTRKPYLDKDLLKILREIDVFLHEQFGCLKVMSQG